MMRTTCIFSVKHAPKGASLASPASNFDGVALRFTANLLTCCHAVRSVLTKRYFFAVGFCFGVYYSCCLIYVFVASRDVVSSPAPFSCRVFVVCGVAGAQRSEPSAASGACVLMFGYSVITLVFDPITFGYLVVARVFDPITYRVIVFVVFVEHPSFRVRPEVWFRSQKNLHLLGWLTQANAAKKRAKPSSAGTDGANSKRPRVVDSVQEDSINGVSVVGAGASVGTGHAGDGSDGNGPSGSSGSVGSSGSIDSGAVRSGVLNIGGPSASSTTSPNIMDDKEKALMATAARTGGRSCARGLVDDEADMRVSVCFVCDDIVIFCVCTLCFRTSFL